MRAKVRITHPQEARGCGVGIDIIILTLRDFFIWTYLHAYIRTYMYVCTCTYIVVLCALFCILCMYIHVNRTLFITAIPFIY